MLDTSNAPRQQASDHVFDGPANDSRGGIIDIVLECARLDLRCGQPRHRCGESVLAWLLQFFR